MAPLLGLLIGFVGARFIAPVILITRTIQQGDSAHLFAYTNVFYFSLFTFHFRLPWSDHEEISNFVFGFYTSKH
ncbi:MAG: hypothetical protein ACRD4B_03625, partial [Acidobacteriota bacterium]